MVRWKESEHESFSLRQVLDPFLSIKDHQGDHTPIFSGPSGGLLAVPPFTRAYLDQKFPGHRNMYRAGLFGGREPIKGLE